MVHGTRCANIKRPAGPLSTRLLHGGIPGVPPGRKGEHPDSVSFTQCGFLESNQVPRVRTQLTHMTRRPNRGPLGGWLAAPVTEPLDHPATRVRARLRVFLLPRRRFRVTQRRVNHRLYPRRPGLPAPRHVNGRGDRFRHADRDRDTASHPPMVRCPCHPGRKPCGHPAPGVAAGWSSSVARCAHNSENAGSNPAPATIPGPGTACAAR